VNYIEEWPNLVFPLLLAPLLLGIINRIKAISVGRQGRPLLQVYFDIIKLLRKNFIYSRTTTWIFRAGPIVGLACLVGILLLTPSLTKASLLTFQGDFLLIIYLLGMMRFFMVSAAFDTGSSFEGMGANREVFFSFLIEPTLLAIFMTMTLITHELSLTGMLFQLNPETWFSLTPPLFFVLVSLFAVLLVENSRIPFDDPNTHLELTMIHEVMVLDHGGPDLALITYASSLKMWIFSSLMVKFLIPLWQGSVLVSVAINLIGIMCIGILVGLVESHMTRIKIRNIPRVLVGITILSLLAMILQKGGN
jgi:formate hydrogenlyase subunit 4